MSLIWVVVCVIRSSFEFGFRLVVCYCGCFVGICCSIAFAAFCFFGLCFKVGWVFSVFLGRVLRFVVWMLVVISLVVWVWCYVRVRLVWVCV